MKTGYVIAGALVAAGVTSFLAWGQKADDAGAAPPPGKALVAVAVPDDLSPEAAMGQTAFDAICAECHGQNAAGHDGSGPPLIHKIYEPSHHGDMAFFLAVERGVRSHHWRFGDMPPVQGLTRADVASIVAYVREVQQFNGIN